MIFFDHLESRFIVRHTVDLDGRLSLLHAVYVSRFDALDPPLLSHCCMDALGMSGTGETN